MTAKTAASALLMFQMLGADLNRSIYAATCLCQGHCLCHHLNKLVADKVTCECAKAEAIHG